MCQLFCDLLEKLSLDENAEILLQPLGSSPAVVGALIDAALSPDKSESIQSSCLKSLAFLIKLSADPEVVVFTSVPSALTLVPSSVPSLLHPLHARIINMIETQMNRITDALAQYSSTSSPDPGSGSGSGSLASQVYAHPGHKVEVPFGWRRILLLEVVVRLAESKASICAFVDARLWRVFMSWITTYPHNNLFHVLFYRLFFVLLK
jgi:hypothetical protein